MYLTQKNHIRADKETYKILKFFTRRSKDLYNYTLYNVRQHFFSNKQFLKYESAYHLVKDNENYQILTSQVAQQTMKIVNRNFKSFFGLLKARKKGTYTEKVNIPKYLPKDDHFPCVFPKKTFKIEGNQVRLSLGLNFTKQYGVRYLYFTMPAHVIGKHVKEVRILPKQNGLYFEIEYIYLENAQKSDLDKNAYFSIDLGLDNFATCITTNGTSFILEGKGIKSFNRWWNKKKARIQSIHDKQKNKKGSQKLGNHYKKRQHVINEYMNKNVHHIIQYCLKHQIGNIVIGELKNIKNSINLGRKNNQNFVNIPYTLFKKKLKGKCELYGIKYSEVDEAYTSQQCSHCGTIDKRNRKYRGLYICKNCGNVLNADVNGALNILRKVAPKSLIGSSGTVDVPTRIRTFEVKLLRSPVR